MTDDLVFSDEQEAEQTHGHTAKPWQVLVVDDEPAVHEVTKLVMSDFEMDGRGLEFTHCYSAAEARTLLGQRNDIALILLDVVMESEHAGLDLAKYIREDLGNLNVRIVLRTGQPGQAPEEQVIRDYDINDYKEKTDLTRRKLITVFYAGLRAYRDLMRLENARRGLVRSIEAISEVGDSHNLRSFASAVLSQLNHLLDLQGEGLCASRLSAYTANAGHGKLKVLAATDAFSELMLEDEVENLPEVVKTAILQSLGEKVSRHGERYYAGYFRTKAGSESLIYMEFPEPITNQARELLELFSRNVASTYDSLLLREETQNTQRDTIATLGGAIERRGTESARHIERVGELAALLARASGCSDAEIEMIRVASTLHDVGKAGIPDQILGKPGPLSAEEWAVMRTHPTLGHTLLSRSSSRLHAMGAKIAQEHHERWDGSGYPAGLKGNEISLVGRIAALADVLDSLVSASPYKPAWDLHQALDYVFHEQGKHFDPELVQRLQDQVEAVKALYQQP
ncbi:COG3437 Response regulator containing a CheY-like receiver domain and an HD-GYP domain [Comamonadaceae bacterium]